MKFYIVYKNTRVPKTPSFRALFPVKPTMSSPASASSVSTATATLALVALNQFLNGKEIFAVTDDGALCVTKPAGKQTLNCVLANCASFPTVFEKLGVRSLPQMAKTESRDFHAALVTGNKLLASFVALFNVASPADQTRKGHKKALDRVPTKEWVKSLNNHTMPISCGAGAGACSGGAGGAGAGACSGGDSVSMTLSDTNVGESLDNTIILLEEQSPIDPRTAASDAASLASFGEDSEWTLASGEDIVSPIEGFLEDYCNLAVALLNVDAAVQFNSSLRATLPRALILSARTARLACLPLSIAVVYSRNLRAARLKAEMLPPSDMMEVLLARSKAEETKANSEVDLHARSLNDMIARFSHPRISAAVNRNIVATKQQISDALESV